MKNNYIYIFCSFLVTAGICFAGEGGELKSFQEKYEAHKNKLQNTTGTLVGWARWQQKLFLKDIPAQRNELEEMALQESQEELFSFLDDGRQNIPIVGSVFLTPDTQGNLPLQRFVVNSSADNFVQGFLFKLLCHEKMPLFKVLSESGSGSLEPLICLIIEKYPLAFVADLVQFIFDDERFGSVALEKLFATEHADGKKVVGWCLYERMLKANKKIEKGLNDLLGFLIEFFLVVIDKKGHLPLYQVAVNTPFNSSALPFLSKLLSDEKMPLATVLSAYDVDEDDPLICLLVEKYPLLFVEEILRFVLDDKRYGFVELEKLLGVERSSDNKTVARILSERLLLINDTVKNGLNHLVQLDRRLSFLRVSLEQMVSLSWCQTALSQQELSQVLIDYIAGNKQDILLNEYLYRLFSVLLPYTVNVLTVLSKDSQDQVLAVLLKFGIIEPLINFLLGIHPEKKEDLGAAKTLLLTPNGLGESLLYQSLDRNIKDLMVSILLVGKSFLEQLVAIPNQEKDTVIHLAARKQANDFFGVLVPLFVEQKKLSSFFSLLKKPGKEGKSAITHIISNANLDLLKKFAGHYAGKQAKQFKRVLAEVALKEQGLHVACTKDDEKLVAFLLRTTSGEYKGKQKLLFSYDQKGFTPIILSIEEHYFSALQALLVYAYDAAVLQKVLRQKDLAKDWGVHLSAFHRALLNDDEGAFIEITRFLKKKGLRKLFDLLLKSKANNQKSGEQLLEEYQLLDRKRFFSYLQNKLSLVVPKNTPKHYASLESFYPSMVIENNSDFVEQQESEKNKALVIKASKSLATFNKNTKINNTTMPFAKHVMEL